MSMPRDGIDDVMEVASRLYNQPLAVQPDVLQFISWARMDLEDIETWMKLSVASSQDAGGTVGVGSPGVAVIPVRGSLFRSSFFSDYDNISASLNAALENPEVGSIVFDIDSPGGEVRGLFDLSNEIYNARGTKPMIAVANDQATSAAYAIASAADTVIASPTSTIGSIGVVAAHVDQSSATEQAGFKVTEIASGKNKTALSSNKPLSSLGRALLEKAVDGAASQFFDIVARNRDMSVDAVREQEAGVYFGRDAVDAGLADQVASLGDVIASHQSHSAEATAVTASQSIAVTTAPEDKQTSTKAEVPNMANPEETPAEVVEEVLEDQVEEAVVETSAEGGEVVDLEQARAEGHAEATNEAREIVELCTLAGLPAKAASYIATGVGVEAVRAELLEAKASTADAEINNSVDAFSSAGSPQVELDPAAIYKARREIGRR